MSRLARFPTPGEGGREKALSYPVAQPLFSAFSLLLQAFSSPPPPTHFPSELPCRLLRLYRCHSLSWNAFSPPFPGEDPPSAYRAEPPFH